MKNTCRTK